MQIKVIERTQEISIQEQEIMRREKELESGVRRPAEAEKYKMEKLAEANMKKMVRLHCRSTFYNNCHNI